MSGSGNLETANADAELLHRDCGSSHLGKVLREYLGTMEVAEAAKRLQVSRTTLSRVLNGRAGISAPSTNLSS